LSGGILSKVKKRNLNLASFYLADSAPQEWSDALKKKVSGEDWANLVASGFEFSLDLLDSGFEFEVIEFSTVRNVARVDV